MITNTATVRTALVVGLVLAAFLVAMFSVDPAGAAVTSGKAFAWGANYDGQLGNAISGPDAYRSTPGNVIDLDNVRSIAGGESHSLAVLQSGGVRSWGYNFDGQLGNGINDSVCYPVDVKNLAGVRSIDGGYSFTLAVAD